MDEAIYNLILIAGTLVVGLIGAGILWATIFIVASILYLPVQLYDWIRYSWWPERRYQRQLERRD